MQTATLKRVTEKLGISLEDLVFYRTLGNKAFIEIDLKLPALGTADNSEPDVFDNIPSMPEDIGIKHRKNKQEQPAKVQNIMTPEEEFRQKYPNIKITRPELFKLVGSMADVPPNVSDKDLIIDAIESI